MSRKAQTQATALAAARARRQKLDIERDERDSRIESALAATMLAIAYRNLQLQEVASANVAVKAAFLLLLAEDVTVERAADLLQLTPLDVKRLMRQPKSDGHPSQPSAAHAGSTAANSDGLRR